MNRLIRKIRAERRLWNWCKTVIREGCDESYSFTRLIFTTYRAAPWLYVLTKMNDHRSR